MVEAAKVKDADVEATIQLLKEQNRKILSVSPSKIVKGIVTEHMIVSNSREFRSIE